MSNIFPKWTNRLPLILLVGGLVAGACVVAGVTYYFTPKEGRILIFPSNLQHEVKENKSDGDRISYSFNIKLIHEE